MCAAFVKRIEAAQDALASMPEGVHLSFKGTALLLHALAMIVRNDNRVKCVRVLPRLRSA